MAMKASQSKAFLPKIQRERLQISKDVVPAGLRAMDYWQIMDYWKLFDKNGDGNMDRNEFFTMMSRMNADPIDRPTSDKIFACVDGDNSGEIDCEEFLSWIFQMYAPYSGGLRERLGEMDPKMVVHYFKKIDTNGNGHLDKAEFWHFISKFCPEANMTSKEAGDLFDTIDDDRSGEIDATEFVKWVYPGLGEGNGRGHSKPVALPPAGRDPHRHGSKKSSKASAGGAHVPDGKPVVLEFTIGPDFKDTMLEIQRTFARKVGDSVSTKIIIDKDCRGCSRFVLRVGRGVVLWDKPAMMAFRDNPFETFDSSRKFVLQTIQERMPMLLKASRIR